MAALSFSLTATANPAQLQATAAQRLPQSYQNFPNGFSALVNFSGGGQGYTFPGALTPAAGTVTLQVTNDPRASQQATNPAVYAQTCWNNHDILANLTADKNDSIFFPCGWVRLVGIITSGTVNAFIGTGDASYP